MPTLHVLRVFVNDEGEWGNRLGVFLDGTEIDEDDRQAVAADLGYSETAFVDSRPTGRLRIHTPEVELPFAGHPTVGVAWLLAETGAPVEALRPPAGEIRARTEEDVAYIVAPARFAPEFEYRRLETPAEVRAPAVPGAGGENLYTWAWIDRAAGTIRARSFVPEEGIAEDEATGSAALVLCSQLARPIVVHQGHGSVIRCRPRGGGVAEIGGRVVLDEVRDYRA